MKIAGETVYKDGTFRDRRPRQPVSIYTNHHRLAWIMLSIILLGLMSLVVMSMIPDDDDDSELDVNDSALVLPATQQSSTVS